MIYILEIIWNVIRLRATHTYNSNHLPLQYQSLCMCSREYIYMWKHANHFGSTIFYFFSSSSIFFHYTNRSFGCKPLKQCNVHATTYVDRVNCYLVRVQQCVRIGETTDESNKTHFFDKILFKRYGISIHEIVERKIKKKEKK